MITIKTYIDTVNMKQYPFSLLIHNIWPPVYVLYIGVITSFHAVCFNVQ